MGRRWVVNASPLILLGKVEQAKLLVDLIDELRASHLGLIPAARPIIAKLREVGLYKTDSLVQRALGHLNE